MTSLKMICFFIVKCYIVFSYRSTNAIDVPYYNILFSRTLKNYEANNMQVAELAIKNVLIINGILGKKLLVFRCLMAGLIIM